MKVDRDPRDWNLVVWLIGTPTYHFAMLFGHAAVRYPRGIVRDGAAHIVFHA